MKNRLLIPVATLALLLSACGTKPVAAVAPASAESTGMTAAKAKFPGYTAADFAAGKALFQGNCGRCHSLHSPSARTEAQWSSIVPRMVVKVNKKEPMAAITPEGEQLILRYLFAASN